MPRSARRAEPITHMPTPCPEPWPLNRYAVASSADVERRALDVLPAERAPDRDAEILTGNLSGVSPSSFSRATRPEPLRDAIDIARSGRRESPRRAARAADRPSASSAVHAGAPWHASSSREGRYGGSSAPGQTSDGSSVRPPQDAEIVDRRGRAVAQQQPARRRLAPRAPSPPSPRAAPGSGSDRTDRSRPRDGVRDWPARTSGR